MYILLFLCVHSVEANRAVVTAFGTNRPPPNMTSDSYSLSLYVYDYNIYKLTLIMYIHIYICISTHVRN